MGFWERRIRNAALGDAAPLYEVQIRFGEAEVAFQDLWPDQSLTADQRDWLQLFAAAAYALKLELTMGPPAMIWEPLIAGHALSGAFVDGLAPVPQIDAPLDRHFAQVYVKGANGSPFIQTPVEGRRAKRGQLASASAVLLFDHVRRTSSKQEERFGALLEILRSLAQLDQFSPRSSETHTAMTIAGLSDLSRVGLIEPFTFSGPS